MEPCSEEDATVDITSRTIERGRTIEPSAEPAAEKRGAVEEELSDLSPQQETEQTVLSSVAELAACDLDGDRPSSAASLSDAEAGAAETEASALFADQEDEEVPPTPSAQHPQEQGAAEPAPPAQQLAASSLCGVQQAGAPTSAASQRSAELGDADILSSCPKHVFVFSTAGKPIYSYRGDESRLAGLMATAEAILSVAHSKGHTLKHVRAGQHVFVFLERPPLCLVGVSALAEPAAVVRMQLVLVHGQIVSLLTASALGAMFARHPGYDLRKLLGGSERLLSSLIDSFTATPAVLLGACPSLPLLGGVRQALATALSAAVKATNAIHGLLVAAGQVAAACAAPGVPALHHWDALLLLNLLAANPSFRHSGEAMTPVCLPRYNSGANLHAYIHYLDAPTHTALVLLCGGMPDFPALAAARQRLQQQLEAVGALQAAVQSAAQEGEQGGSGSGSSGNHGSSGGSSVGSHGSHAGQSNGTNKPSSSSSSSNGALFRAPAISSSSGGGAAALLAIPNLPAAAGGGLFGSTPLLHIVYRHSGRQRYVMSPFSAPLLAAGLRQALIVAYSQLRASMFEGSSAAGGPLQRLRFEQRRRFVLLGSVSTDTELFLAFDALTDKAEAAGICSRLGMWLSARHDQLFGP